MQILKDINLKELLKQKYVKNMIIIIMVIILLFIGISIYFTIKGRRISDYSRLETVVYNAAKNYYSANPESLPKEIGATTSIDDATLSTEGYMKQMINIAPKNVDCKAVVTVKNVNGGFTYYTNLDCGKQFKSETLAEHILANQQIVTSGDGLYETNGDYVYRGEFPNNYITFAGKKYQIVSINSDKSITIINSTRKKDLERPVWDDRFNPESFGGQNGINDYGISRIKQYLNEYINGSAFKDSDRSKLMYQTLCIGKVGSLQKVDRNSECSQTLDNQIIGLLPISHYTYVSLDSQCNNVTSGSCQNYNYLSKFETSWWTLTASTDKSYKAYSVPNRGAVSSLNCSSRSYPREVLKLTDLVSYKSGNGSIDSPFEIK